MAREIIVADSGSHCKPGVFEMVLAATPKFLETRQRFSPQGVALEGEFAAAREAGS